MRKREQKWKPAPPSPTCEHRNAHSQSCGKQTVYCYPAMGGGYMALCSPHAQKHLAYCIGYESAQRGENPYVEVPAHGR